MPVQDSFIDYICLYGCLGYVYTEYLPPIDMRIVCRVLCLPCREPQGRYVLTCGQTTTLMQYIYIVQYFWSAESAQHAYVASQGALFSLFPSLDRRPHATRFLCTAEDFDRTSRTTCVEIPSYIKVMRCNPVCRASMLDRSSAYMTMLVTLATTVNRKLHAFQ
jgi:hypothetical protein